MWNLWISGINSRLIVKIFINFIDNIKIYVFIDDALSYEKALLGMIQCDYVQIVKFINPYHILV